MTEILTKKEVVLKKLDEILQELNSLEEKLESDVSDVLDEETSSYMVNIKTVSDQLTKIEHSISTNNKEIQSSNKEKQLFHLTLSY